MSADEIDPPPSAAPIGAPADSCGDQVAVACAALAAAIDELQAAGLPALSPAELIAALDAVETQARRLPTVRDAVLAEARIRDVASAHGFRSTGAWLRDRFRIGAGEARTWLRGADRLTPRRTLTGDPLAPLLPATAAARAAGRVSTAHVKVIDDLDDELPTALPVAARREIEERMVRHAQNVDPVKLLRFGQQLLDAVDPDGAEPNAEEAHRRRGITIGPLRRGLARISGHVDAWTREAILAVLAALADPDPPATPTPNPGRADDTEKNRATEHDMSSESTTPANAEASSNTTSDQQRPGAAAPDDDTDWPTWGAGPATHDTDSPTWGAGPATHDTNSRTWGAGPHSPDCDPLTCGAGADTPDADWPDHPPPDRSNGPIDRTQESGPAGHGPPLPLGATDQPQLLPLDPDRRTHPQRLHDALRDACERLLSDARLPRRGGTPATILLTVPLATLEHRAGMVSTANGGEIPISEVIRRAGDTTFVPVVIDRHRNPLFLGRRQRLASWQQRYALHIRDGGCVIPGCVTPAHDCHTHHLEDWADGGPTDLTNLALLCTYHHYRIKHWHLKLTQGRIWCTPPSWIHREQAPQLNCYFRDRRAEGLCD